jgi:hypothetical protein
MSDLRLPLAFVAFLLGASPAAAQPSGVLLGVAVGDPDRANLQVLRTYWIVGDARGAEVKAILPGLLVPRADGFVRIGVVRSCEPFPDEDLNEGLGGPHKGDVRCTDAYWVAPGTASPPPSDRAGEGDDVPCSYQSRTIRFASPIAVASRFYDGNSESCEPRGWHWSEAALVHAVGGREPIDAADVLGPRAAAAFADAARRAEVTLNEEGFDTDDTSCHPDPANLLAWTIERRLGGWEPRLFQQIGQGWCTLEAPLRLPLPRRWAGRAASLAAARRAGVDDVVSAPGGSWSLTFKRAGLSFLRPNPAAAPDRAAPGLEVVMAEWATGPHVARWSAYIGALPQVTDDAGGPAPLRAK